jgi:hypothetical protein
MNVRYYIDPETGAPHIHNHGVTESEVEDILARPGEDRPGTEGTRVALGQTSAGRYLRVIYVAETGGVFVITAYDLAGKPLLAYRRRRRRKR